MTGRGTLDLGFAAIGLAMGLLLVITSPVEAKDQREPQDRSRNVPLQLVQSPRAPFPQHRIQALPAEHIDTIQRFIAAIDEHRPTDAVGIMSAELVPDAVAKREWIRHFSAIRSIQIRAIEPSAVAATAPCHAYKVTLEADVSADPEAAVPFYGWQENPNARWVELCPDQTGAWAIASFGTGP